MEVWNTAGSGNTQFSYSIFAFCEFVSLESSEGEWWIGLVFISFSFKVSSCTLDALYVWFLNSSHSLYYLTFRLFCLWMQKPLRVGFWTFDRLSSMSLISCSWYRPGISHFLEETWSLLVRNDFRSFDLGLDYVVILGKWSGSHCFLHFSVHGVSIYSPFYESMSSPSTWFACLSPARQSFLLELF